MHNATRMETAAIVIQREREEDHPVRNVLLLLLWLLALSEYSLFLAPMFMLLLILIRLSAITGGENVAR